MSYTLEIQNAGGYLHVKVSGRNTAANVASYLAHVRQECSERGCFNVLIEENLQGPSLGLATIYQIVREACQQHGGGVRRIACVDVNPEHKPEHMEFAETTAANWGVNVRIFATVQDAENWLRKEVSSDPKG